MLKVAAAILERNGEIFICQRRAGKHLAFLWEFPGGKLEPGETLEECLRRECQEELGVNVSSPILFEQFQYSYPEVTVELAFFRCRIEHGEPCGKEGQNVRWIRKDELSRYAFCPADLGVVKKLLQENE